MPPKAAVAAKSPAKVSQTSPTRAPHAACAAKAPARAATGAKAATGAAKAPAKAATGAAKAPTKMKADVSVKNPAQPAPAPAVASAFTYDPTDPRGWIFANASEVRAWLAKHGHADAAAALEAAGWTGRDVYKHLSVPDFEQRDRLHAAGVSAGQSSALNAWLMKYCGHDQSAKGDDVLRSGVFDDFPGRVIKLSQVLQTMTDVVNETGKFCCFVDPLKRVPTFFAYNSYVVSAKFLLMSKMKGKDEEWREKLRDFVASGIKKQSAHLALLLDMDNSAVDLTQYFNPLWFPQEIFSREKMMTMEVVHDLLVEKLGEAELKFFMFRDDFQFVVTSSLHDPADLPQLLKDNMVLVRVVMD